MNPASLLSENYKLQEKFPHRHRRQLSQLLQETNNETAHLDAQHTVSTYLYDIAIDVFFNSPSY